MSKFSPTEKKKCAERELAMRLRVYTKWIAQGKMKLEDAEREMDLMRSIAEDYLKLEEKENAANRSDRPTLFEADGDKQIIDQ